MPPSFVDVDIVAMAVARLAGMIDVRIDVLNERSAGGDVHDLHAEADAERRDAALARQFGEAEVVLLPTRIHRLAARMLFLAVLGRIAVVSTGEENAVERFGEISSVLRLRRNEHRHRAGAFERFDIGRVDKGAIAFPLLLNDVRADADERLVHGG
jgi:hypothetical protein